MSDKELIEYMLKNEQIQAGIRTATILNILANAMIKKGWFTEDEFNKAVEEGLEKMAKISLNKFSKEQREMLETQAKLAQNDLFGRFFQ